MHGWPFPAPDAPARRPGEGVFPPHGPAQPLPEEGAWTWDSVALTQQRLWQHWLEAGSTWLTWWAGSLPPMGWPPVGQVLPPAADPAPPLHSADHAPTRRTAPRQPSAQPRTHRARERRP